MWHPSRSVDELRNVLVVLAVTAEVDIAEGSEGSPPLELLREGFRSVAVVGSFKGIGV